MVNHDKTKKMRLFFTGFEHSINTILLIMFVIVVFVSVIYACNGSQSVESSTTKIKPLENRIPKEVLEIESDSVVLFK